MRKGFCVVLVGRAGEMRATTQLPYLGYRVELPHQSRTRCLYSILLVVQLLLVACSVSTQQREREVAANIIVASRVAQDCRSQIGSNHQYQRLAKHIPLG